MSIKKQSAADELKTWTLIIAFVGFMVVYIVGFIFAWGEGMSDFQRVDPSRATARDFITAFFPLAYILSGILISLNGRLYNIKFITPRGRLLFYLTLPLLFGLSILMYRIIWIK